VDWGDHPTDRYPRIIVTVSRTMRANFARFGDLLSFDVTYNLIKNNTSDGRRYRLGVFTVFDTNIRILLAGIVIMCQ
jgi:hypothetical protein